VRCDVVENPVTDGCCLKFLDTLPMQMV